MSNIHDIIQYKNTFNITDEQVKKDLGTSIPIGMDVY